MKMRGGLTSPCRLAGACVFKGNIELCAPEARKNGIDERRLSASRPQVMDDSVRARLSNRDESQRGRLARAVLVGVVSYLVT